MPDDDRPRLSLVSDLSRLDVARATAERRAADELDRVGFALRRCTANLLRICRGAGNASLVAVDFSHVADCLAAYRASVGQFPRSDQIAEMLRLQEPHLKGYDPDDQVLATAEHDVVRGALQFTASSLLDQLTHKHKGHQEIFEGVQVLHRFYAERDADRAAAAKAERAASRANKSKSTSRRPAKRKTIVKPRSLSRNARRRYRDQRQHSICAGMAAGGGIIPVPGTSQIALLNLLADNTATCRALAEMPVGF